MVAFLDKMIATHPLAFGTLAIFVFLVVLVFVVLFVTAFVQGRSVSMWPPKIGNRPIQSPSVVAPAQVVKSNTKDEIAAIDTSSPITTSNREYILTESVTRKIISIQEKLKRGEDAPYALLGSTYIDVVVGPISTKSLSAEEWSDLEPIQVRIGGSSMCVGRYLWSDYRRRCYLFTTLSGKNDVFSSEFRRLLEIEKGTWLIDDGIVISNNNSAPLTVILRQLDRTYTTMFTHRGTLSSFTWNDVQPAISQLLSGGGLLYLSGFIKTNLSKGLVENLRTVHTNTLVCLDHGRLNLRTDNPSTLKAVFDAFSSGLIDVYVCSFKEILDFYHIISGRKNEYDYDNMRDTLEKLARSEVLPPITIVRNTIGEKSVSAFSIVGRVVDSIPDHSRRWFDNTPVAPLNAFNAAVLECIISTPMDSADGLRGHVIEICQNALKACHRIRNEDPSSI